MPILVAPFSIVFVSALNGRSKGKQKNIIITITPCRNVNKHLYGKRATPKLGEIGKKESKRSACRHRSLLLFTVLKAINFKCEFVFVCDFYDTEFFGLFVYN